MMRQQNVKVNFYYSVYLKTSRDTRRVSVIFSP